MNLSFSCALKSLETKYQYLLFSENDYQTMAKSVLETMKNENTKTEEYFISKMEKKIHEKKKVILRKPAYVERVLSSFIHENISLTKDNQKNLESLYDISEFLKKLNNAYTIDTFITLLNQNEKFHELIREVVEKNLVSIKNIVKDDAILSMIQAYTMLHDMEEEKMDLKWEIEETFTNSYKSYVREISKYPVLTKEEEQTLFLRVQNHDEEARKKLIECNLKLVVSIALKYTKKENVLLDMIQDGNIGLMKAIDRFDVSKGCKFSTYAPWWIKHFIRRGIENKGRMIRFPTYVHYDLKEYRKGIEDLQNRLSRNPTLKELAAYLRKSEDEVLRLSLCDEEILSTNYPTNEDETNVVEDFIPDESESVEDTAVRATLNEEIRILFEKAKLNEREKNVLLLRNDFYGHIYSLDEIGKMYGITRERARQIQAKALYKLRNASMVKTFADYMDYPSQSCENLDEILEEYKNDVNHHYYKSFTTHGNGTLNQQKKENLLLECIKASLIKEEFETIREYLTNEKAKRLLEYFEPIEAVVYTLKKHYTIEYVAYLLEISEKEVELLLARALRIAENHPKSIAKLERKK